MTDIPDAAIEAAAKAWFEALNPDGWDSVGHDSEAWHVYRNDVRIALAAAAGHLYAAALREAADEYGNFGVNPDYASRSVTYTRTYLRDRADAIGDHHG